jgi:hypothetical protein
MLATYNTKKTSNQCTHLRPGTADSKNKRLLYLLRRLLALHQRRLVDQQRAKLQLIQFMHKLFIGVREGMLMKATVQGYFSTIKGFG